MPAQEYGLKPEAPVRASSSRRSREYFEDPDDDDWRDEPRRRRNGDKGVRFRIRGGLPRTKWGRIAMVVSLLGFAGLCWGAFVAVRSAVMHDERFVIPSTSSIEIQGNEHVTRAELLSIFGEDVERNIFKVPLEERKAELEQLPWVERATVMRLLPNRLRVAVVERTPVAFVRQGNHIGLIDTSGVLLNMPTDVQANMNYSFPVVSGISANDPASLRAARMKIYQRFTSDLDSGGDKVSRTLSEVDLSNPEDVKALIPDQSNEVLVHFGEDSFLERYKKFEEHLPEWRAQYPHLASADMRYERQVVLEMKLGSDAPAAANATGAPEKPDDAQKSASAPAAAKPAAPARPAASKSMPAHKAPPKKSAAAVHARPKHVAPPAAQPLYHPPQVVHP